MLELAADSGTACAFSEFWTARLRTLARIFAGGVAHVLARLRWFAVSRGSFGDHHLFCDAATAESGADATDDGLIAHVYTALVQFADV